MSIFNNKNVTVNKGPYLDTFINMESFDYKLLHDLEYDSFKISLEFNQTVYNGLKSNDIEIVNEGFTDFFKKAAKFFKDLALKIVEFSKKYIKFFISYMQDFNRFLEKNKDFLKSLNPNFTYTGYEFKFPEAPNITKAYDIIDSYNIEINKIDTMKYADISKMREEFANETYKNKIRASVLGSGEIEVSQDTFKEKSKNLFRDSNSEIKITVNNQYINKIIDEYGKMKKLLDDTEKNKVKIIKLLHDLEFFFDRKASVVYDKEEKRISTSTINREDDKFKRNDSINTQYDENKLTTLNSYFDLKYRESKFISSCLITVYMDKIEAIKDCMKQYKDITRQALVNKTDKSEAKSEVK